MTNLPMVSRPVRDSILKAAANVAATAPNAQAALPATRDATLALEFHLDTLARELAGDIQPRLLRRACEVESRLRAALLECWAVERDLRTGPVAARGLRELAARIRAVGDDEIDLVFEALRDPGALD